MVGYLVRSVAGVASGIFRQRVGPQSAVVGSAAGSGRSASPGGRRRPTVALGHPRIEGVLAGQARSGPLRAGRSAAPVPRGRNSRSASAPTISATSAISLMVTAASPSAFFTRTEPFVV